MNVGVCYLGRRIDRLHVAGLRELQRWPFHGLAGAIAFRFDGRTLTLVRLATLERPSERGTRKGRVRS